MKIRILGCDIPVVVSEMSSMGEYLVYEDTIFINDKLAGGTVGETLLHEVVEAIDEKLELSLDHRQITGLSAGIYSLLRSECNEKAIIAIATGTLEIEED